MEELLKGSFWYTALATAIIGSVVFSLIVDIPRKFKEIQNLKLRITLSVGVCSLLVCFWAYFILYRFLYPVALAYHECNNSLAKESIGFVEDMEVLDKERLRIKVDGKTYTALYSRKSPNLDMESYIFDGDKVKIKYGEKSKYIFDIIKLE